MWGCMRRAGYIGPRILIPDSGGNSVGGSQRNCQRVQKCFRLSNLRLHFTLDVIGVGGPVTNGDGQTSSSTPENSPR